MNKANILSEIKKLMKFSTTEQSFLDAKSLDGTIVRVEGDKFDVGKPLLLVTADGLIASKPGVINLEDGTILVVDEAGIITSVEFPTEGEVQASVENFAETTTLDGMKVKVEGDLAVGNKMLVEEGGVFVDAKPGQYNLADGTVVYVDEAGLINEIETAETEAVSEEDMAEEVVVEEETKVKPDEKMGELEARVTEIEKMINEMLPMMKQTVEFGNTVIGKIDNFVKETPAEQQFASIKSEYKQLVKESKDNKFSGLEGIKNMRKK